MSDAPALYSEYGTMILVVTEAPEAKGCKVTKEAFHEAPVSPSLPQPQRSTRRLMGLSNYLQLGLGAYSSLEYPVLCQLGDYESRYTRS